MAEFALIERIRTRTAIERADVRLGIGDDGAVLAIPAAHELVVCTDTLVAGVHFPLETSAGAIGWKALAVNLSDLAAMGATPAWATLALTLPSADAVWIEAFADGFAALAGDYKLALVGGDTTRGPLAATVTAHGFVPEGRALRRAGARPGDLVFVTGTLGDAAAGLACLDRSHARAAALLAAPAALREQAIARLERPTPRIAHGLALRDLASACIDVSDGLVADLGHICAASGVGAEIELDRLPASSALLGLFEAEARAAFQLAGGDDYELCFCIPPIHVERAADELARLGGGITRIGRIVESDGVCVLDGDGREIAVPRGWEHFA